MSSIRSKITALSLLCILVCTAVTAGISLVFISRVQEQSSDQVVSLTCLQQATKVNQELLGVEGSVDTCAEIVTSSLEALDDIHDEVPFEATIDDMELLVGSIAQNTAGVCTYYLRISRDPNIEPSGFFYTKLGRDMALTKEPLTPIIGTDPSDVERVGWYYLPERAGKAIWMDPYYNKNIDVYMISYVAPLYCNKKFVGVVGMDIDLNVIINTMRHVRPYETGFACLMSNTGTIYYHPTVESDTSIVAYAPELRDEVEALEYLQPGEMGETITYSGSEGRQKLSYCALRNRMVLAISASTAEINDPMNDMLRTLGLQALLIACIAALAALRLSDHITKPLVQLTEAADRIARGDMEVILPHATNDEVGVLTKSFDITVRNLKAFITGINEKAYRDALTMVKNKAAYDEACGAIGERMRQGDRAFGIVVFDANGLKAINDNYGHDRGDEYLRACCQMVCHVFDHSPVYRVGGDEFVVVLRGSDFEARETLLAEVDRRMQASQRAEQPWQRISVAKGLAVCQPQDGSVDDVFHRADQAMYEEKRRMKGRRA